MTTTDIAGALNAYEGDNVWEDVIYTLPGYDEHATCQVDVGRSDRAVIDGVEYRWDESTRTWAAA